MFGLGGEQRSSSVEELRAQLEAREAENADLQEQIQAFRAADQRDFLNDNSDQLAAVINTKNLVIQELQAQLQERGQEEGLAQALQTAATSAAEVDRLRHSCEELRGQLEAAQGHVSQLQATIAAAPPCPPQSTENVAAPSTEALQQQLELYKAENNRQAQELASSATSHAMEVARLQAILKATAAATQASQPPPVSSGPSHAEEELRSLRDAEAKKVRYLEGEMANQDRHIADLEARLQAASAAPAPHEQVALQTANDRIQSLETELQAELSKAQQAAAAASEKEAAIAAKFVALEAQLSNAQQAAKAGSEKEAESAAKLSVLEAELSRVQQVASAGFEKEAESAAKLIALEAELSNAQQAAMAGSAKEAESAAKLLVLEAELSKAQQAATAASEKENEVATKFVALEAELFRAQQAAKVGSESESEIAARFVALEAELSKAQQAANARSEQEAGTAAKIVALEAELSKAQQAANVGSEQEAGAAAKVAVLEAELSRLQGAAQASSDMGAEYAAKLVDLEARLELSQQKEALAETLAKQAVASHAEALSEAENKVEAHRARVVELEATLAEQQKASEQAAQSLADFERKWQDQQESYTTTAALVEAQETARASAAKVDELEAELNRRKLREQEEENHTSNAALVEAQEEAKAAAAQTAELEVTKAALQTASDRIQMLETELQAAANIGAASAAGSDEADSKTANGEREQLRIEVQKLRIDKAELENQRPLLEQQVTQLRAALVEKDAAVEAANNEVAEARKHARASSDEVAEARRSVHDLTAKAQTLEAKLLRAKGEVQLAEQRAAAAAGMTEAVAKGDASSPLAGLGSGNLQNLIVGALQDVEMGERSCVTVRDLGLGDVAGIKELDNALRMLSALMAVRADARLVVFGMWFLCHTIYIIYLLYEHFIRR